MHLRNYLKADLENKNKLPGWQVLLSVFIKTKLSVFFTYNSCCLTLTQFFFCCLFLEFVSCFCIWLFLIDIVVLEIIPKIEPWEYQVSFFLFPFFSHHYFYWVLFYLIVFFSTELCFELNRKDFDLSKIFDDCLLYLILMYILTLYIDMYMFGFEKGSMIYLFFSIFSVSRHFFAKKLFLHTSQA